MFFRPPARSARAWVVLFGLLPAVAVAPQGVAVSADGTVVEVAVLAGERAAGFGRRLERLGLGSAELLAEIARREPLGEYRFLPPAEALPGLRRFEGMFPPGSWRVTVPGGGGYGVCLAVTRALLEESRRRLEGLAAESGLSPDNGLSLPETLALAGLVEKETVGRQGYTLVASVFLKRLRHGVRLCSCPSVEYALGYHRPFLLRSDLAVDSPYNTYRHPGLPPGPICFFSDEALRAAARPADSPYWFFLFDWAANELVFSAGQAEHERRSLEARRGYVRRFGPGSLYRRYPGLFYEPVGAPGGALAQVPSNPLP